MKSYLKTTAGVVLSATMATASYGATVNVGELQGFTGPLESMIGAMSGGANLAVTEANASVTARFAPPDIAPIIDSRGPVNP